jgi:hypothetical protein
MKVESGFIFDTRIPFSEETLDLIFPEKKIKEFNFIKIYTVNQTLVVENTDIPDIQNKKTKKRDGISYFSKNLTNDNIDYILVLKNSLFLSSIFLPTYVYNKKYFFKFYSRAIKNVLEEKHVKNIEISENNILVDGKKLSITIFKKNELGIELFYFTFINYEINEKEKEIAKNKNIELITIADIVENYTKEDFEKDLEFMMKKMLENEGFS